MYPLDPYFINAIFPELSLDALIIDQQAREVPEGALNEQTENMMDIDPELTQTPVCNIDDALTGETTASAVAVTSSIEQVTTNNIAFVTPTIPHHLSVLQHQLTFVTPTIPHHLSVLQRELTFVTPTIPHYLSVLQRELTKERISIHAEFKSLAVQYCDNHLLNMESVWRTLHQKFLIKPVTLRGIFSSHELGQHANGNNISDKLMGTLQRINDFLKIQNSGY